MKANHFFKGKSVVLTIYTVLGCLIFAAAYAVYSANGFSTFGGRASFEQAGVYAVNDMRGGKIILSVPQQQILDSAVHQESWTKVQWQNASGNWIDVDGWQGSFHPESSDSSLFVEWWVGPEIMGDGPFRWVIYADGYANQYLSTTRTFSLPQTNLQSIVVVPDLQNGGQSSDLSVQSTNQTTNQIAASTTALEVAEPADDEMIGADAIPADEETVMSANAIESPTESILATVEVTDTAMAELDNQVFFVSKTGDNSDGLSWATAWNEMDQIKWEIIQAGDVIQVDGGRNMANPMQYSTPLRPTASGELDSPITVQLADDERRDGQIILFGGNDQLLPECGQLDWDALAHQEAGESAIVFADGVSNIVVDGRKRHGITIHGWRKRGINFDPDRTDNGVDDNTKNITLRYMHIYNNGDVVQRVDDDSVDLFFPANNSPGIKLSGTGHTFSFLEIHDNAADAIQSNFTNPEGGVFNNIGDFTLTDSWLYNQRAHTGVDNSPLGEVCSAEEPDGCDEFGAPQMAIDYHFYPEEPVDRREAFNWCTHNDGIQIYSSNDFNNLTIERTIVGPNLMTGLLLGDRGGDTTTAWVNNLNLTDVVITRFTHGALGMKNPPEQAGENWNLNHVTIYGHYSNINKGTLNIDSTADSVEHSISNSTMVFGQTEFPSGNIVFENNCEFNLYSGTLEGQQVDPEFNSIIETDVFENDLSVDFATVFTDDYRPNNMSCSGSVARISSVDMLISGFNSE